MSYATLMVHLRLGQPNTELLKIVGDLAVRLHAAVTGVAVCQPMRIVYSNGYVGGDIIEQDRQQIENEMKAAESDFHAALDGRVAVVEWRSVVTFGPLSKQLAAEACCADLLITGVDREFSLLDASRHVDIGDLVMQAGRPCLIIPETVDRLALRHVVVGWKDTAETRRAVSAALPLLKQADQVTVAELAAEDEFASARDRLGDVRGWLQRHGIEAKTIVSTLTADESGRLDAIVQEQGGDLLVAGAYGHSRLREWVLGGVTRDLLLRARRCSLVSH